MAIGFRVMDTKIKERKKMKKPILIIGGAIIVVALGVAGFFGGKAIYNNGVMNGRRAESDEMTDKLKALGNAVFEKENFQKTVNKVFSDFPTEVDSEGIDSYIEKLSGLIDGLSTEKVKTVLEEYLNKWQEFKDVYDSEDNNEITENFDELKAQAKELSTKIKTLFDESIKESLEEL